MEGKKLSKFFIKDFVKDNSIGHRLQSLRSPRDLSLGGTKVLKKNYKPNLNAVRNKDKAKVPIKCINKLKIQPKILEDKSKDRFIQSSGVFSEGIGDPVRLPQNRIYAKEREKPPPVKHEPRRVEKRSGTDTQVFEEIIKYDDDSDSDTEVNIPFKPIDWCVSKSTEDALKEEVKLEISDEEKVLPQEFANGTENSKLSLTLWQLPDSFSSKNQAEDSKNKKLSDCKLSDLPEGKVGRICVCKSGKMIVYIGNLQYELEPAQLDSFMEEVVSVHVSPSQESKATVLGNIENRFVLNPLWTSLLS